jgi:lipid II:glycine glycyltransferase (peptidoglycan interpeptide bridge formation enzyme)
VEKNISTSVDPSKWDSKQLALGASFLQSLQWAEFQKSLGHDYRLLAGDGWSCLVLIKTNRFGRYIFAPYGPTLRSANYLADCLISLIGLGRELKLDWLKIEPLGHNGETAELVKIIKQHKGRRAVHDNEPALTRIIDLTPSANDLLAGISQSTRSLIRKTDREKLLSFKTSFEPNDMIGFTAMLDMVADRQGIGFFPAEYFVKQAERLMPAKMMFLEQAYSGDQLVGYAVMHDYGTTSSYSYAASLPEARKLSVSAMLLWRAITNAKARGMKKMDLYGSAPDDALPSHPWYGFSSYKKKFGGQLVQLSGTWDIPLTRKYRTYRLAQSVYRRLRR